MFQINNNEINQFLIWDVFNACIFFSVHLSVDVNNLEGKKISKCISDFLHFLDPLINSWSYISKQFPLHILEVSLSLSS